MRKLRQITQSIANFYKNLHGRRRDKYEVCWQWKATYPRTRFSKTGIQKVRFLGTPNMC